MSNQKDKISYDQVPYPAYTFSYTNPEYLKTIGKLFGLNLPNLANARILDIGCGVGINMFNFAETYPNSYSLGIDTSEIQIAEGHKTIKELNLKNIDLKTMSVTDIDESYGKFDYIICHGVFSWVPSHVKEKIFEVIHKLLNQDGLAFVSYNTLPGWNMQNTIREMMMFHAKLFADTNHQFQQAKSLLNFVNESLENSQLPYANFLRDETKNLFSYDDSYVLHEYLGEENTGFYFYQFMEMANRYQLNYLGDTHLASMYVGNLPSKAREKLEQISDIVRTEQYMDFINNRKFRSTLLCHNNVKINRHIEFNNLKSFYTTFNIRPSKPLNEVDLNNEQETINFYYKNLPKIFISASSSLMKAILYTYSENIGNPLTFEQVAKAALKKLDKFQLKDYLTVLENNFLTLIFQGAVEIFAEKPNAISTISEKPKTNSIAIYQVRHKIMDANKQIIGITNKINDLIGIHLHEQYILELLDGTNTIQEIKQQILEKLKSKTLIAFDSNKQEISDSKLFKELADNIVNTALEKFRINYLLVG